MARALNINYTTANSIVNVYRKQGRVKKIPQKNRKKHQTANPEAVSSPKEQKSVTKQEIIEEKKDTTVDSKLDACSLTNSIRIEDIKEIQKPRFHIPSVSNELRFLRFSNNSDMGDINANGHFPSPSLGLNLSPLAGYQRLQASQNFLSSSINPNFQISSPTLGEIMHASRILSLSANLQNVALNPLTFPRLQDPRLPLGYVSSLHNVGNVQNLRNFSNLQFYN